MSSALLTRSPVPTRKFAPSMPPGGTDSDEISFRGALRVVRKRYRFILLVAAAIALLTMIVSLVLRPYYAAVATIEIQRDNSNPLDASGLGSIAESIGGSDDVKTQLTTEM